jgi:hypothetical protein
MAGAFDTETDLERGGALSTFLFNFAFEDTIRNVEETNRVWNSVGHSSFCSMLKMLIC